MPHDKRLSIKLKKLELDKLQDEQNGHNNEYLYLQKKIIKLEREIKDLEKELVR